MPRESNPTQSSGTAVFSANVKSLRNRLLCRHTTELSDESKLLFGGGDETKLKIQHHTRRLDGILLVDLQFRCSSIEPSLLLAILFTQDLGEWLGR